MLRFIAAIITAVIALTAPATAATGYPEQVATVVVHGFDPDGASSTGVFGADETKDYVAGIAATINLQMSVEAPLEPSQLAYTTYYGDTYPSYYTSEDIAEVEAVTAQHGGGVPRYALIIGKYAREVMRRSGATQVNLVAVSFGGLVSRYLIEKDVEGLASSGRIARWICIEGVVTGNFAATHGGTFARIFFESYYGGAPVDFDHMHYDWVTANLNDPRDSTSSPYYADFPTHFWVASDDEFNNRYLTNLSGKPNDGVVLVEDAFLRNLPPQSKYLGLVPTFSATHTHHEATKDHMGIRAGLAAQLFGRRRVTIILDEVMVKNEFDGGLRGQGEYVFGIKVISPLAESSSGISQPIHEYRAQDSTFPFLRLTPGVPLSVNLQWFDDMILPGETELRLESNVDEVDGDLIYGVGEAPEGTYQALADTIMTVSAGSGGTYLLETADWRAQFRVSTTNYPAFQDLTPRAAAANTWSLYE